MATLANLVQVETSTTGTGTLTLGAAVPGYLTFAQAGVPNGATVSYAILNNSQSEVGRGVYNSGAGTLTRGVLASTNSNALINISGRAVVIVTALAQDFNDKADRSGAVFDTDIRIAQGTGGAIFFGTTGSSDYIYHDGTNFYVNGGPIVTQATGGSADWFESRIHDVRELRFSVEYYTDVRPGGYFGMTAGAVMTGLYTAVGGDNVYQYYRFLQAYSIDRGWFNIVE